MFDWNGKPYPKEVLDAIGVDVAQQMLMTAAADSLRDLIGAGAVIICAIPSEPRPFDDVHLLQAVCSLDGKSDFMSDVPRVLHLMAEQMERDMKGGS